MADQYQSGANFGASIPDTTQLTLERFTEDDLTFGIEFEQCVGTAQMLLHMPPAQGDDMRWDYDITHAVNYAYRNGFEGLFSQPDNGLAVAQEQGRNKASSSWDTYANTWNVSDEYWTNRVDVQNFVRAYRNHELRTHGGNDPNYHDPSGRNRSKPGTFLILDDGLNAGIVEIVSRIFRYNELKPNNKNPFGRAMQHWATYMEGLNAYFYRWRFISLMKINTGIHVHVGVGQRTFDVRAVKNLAMILLTFEHVIDLLHDVYRVCEPEWRHFRTAWMYIHSNRRMVLLCNGHKQWDINSFDHLFRRIMGLRYISEVVKVMMDGRAAMRSTRLKKYNFYRMEATNPTMEFRQFKQSTDIMHIHNWCRVVTKIVSVAYSFKDVHALYYALMGSFSCRNGLVYFLSDFLGFNDDDGAQLVNFYIVQEHLSANVKQFWAQLPISDEENDIIKHEEGRANDAQLKADQSDRSASNYLLGTPAPSYKSFQTEPPS